MRPASRVVVTDPRFGTLEEMAHNGVPDCMERDISGPGDTGPTGMNLHPYLPAGVFDLFCQFHRGIGPFDIPAQKTLFRGTSGRYDECLDVELG
jgi:hypothetical protein